MVNPSQLFLASCNVYLQLSGLAVIFIPIHITTPTFFVLKNIWNVIMTDNYVYIITG